MVNLHPKVSSKLNRDNRNQDNRLSCCDKPFCITYFSNGDCVVKWSHDIYRNFLFLAKMTPALSPNLKNRCRNGKSCLLLFILSLHICAEIFVDKVEFSCSVAFGGLVQPRVIGHEKCAKYVLTRRFKGALNPKLPTIREVGCQASSNWTRPWQPTAVRNFGNSWGGSHSGVQHS